MYELARVRVNGHQSCYFLYLYMNGIYPPHVLHFAIFMKILTKSTYMGRRTRCYVLPKKKIYANVWENLNNKIYRWYKINNTRFYVSVHSYTETHMFGLYYNMCVCVMVHNNIIYLIEYFLCPFCLFFLFLAFL